MRAAALIGTLAVTLLAVVGCTTTNSDFSPRPAVFATNRPSEPRLEEERIKEFSTGEPIGIVVDLPRGSGYGDRSSTTTVTNTSSGKQIASWTRHMRETQRYVFPLENPGPGTYRIDLTYDDSDSPRTAGEFVVR